MIAVSHNVDLIDLALHLIKANVFATVGKDDITMNSALANVPEIKGEVGAALM